MRRVRLPQTAMSVSRFAFDTSRLFNVGGPKQRADLLAAAHDAGFTHFDTAPYYGFGMAERDLRPLLQAHPAITVATKVGLYSPGGEDQSPRAIVLRKAAGRLVRALSKPEIDWNVARARDALSASLQRLGRARVDLYLLHEPRLDLLQADEWLRWLESEGSSGTGRVAHFGLAVVPRHLPAFLHANNALAAVVQTADSLGTREADALLAHRRPLQITAGYLSAARSQPGFEPRAVLAAALRRNATGCIIVNTSRIGRLRDFAEISDAVDREDAAAATVAAQ